MLRELLSGAVPRFVKGLGTGLLAGVLVALSLPAPVRAGPGDLDPTFGSGGMVTTRFIGGGAVQALALQADGKIVVAGSSAGRDDLSDFALARYNPDGSLDPSFGNGGKVTTDFGGDDAAFAVALQADGKIVVAGFSFGQVALARYNSDGTLDPSFGSGGKVTTSFGDCDGSAYALSLQPDGKIIVAGVSCADFLLVRYNPDGSLDSGFGSRGKVTTNFGALYLAVARALALQADGKIVAAGVFGVDFALARYNPDGSLDPSFGNGGKVTTDFGGAADAFALALQQDGKIVATGPCFVFRNYFFALARYNADGSLDANFGTGGKVLTHFVFAGPLALRGRDFAEALALQPDGKIVVAGWTEFSLSEFVTLARYTAAGQLDAPFAGGVELTTNFGGSGSAEVHALALQPDGKIIVAGEFCASGNCERGDFALARYRGDPKLFLGLTLNQASFGPGDILEVGTREANSGPETSVDKHLGLFLPHEAGPAVGCSANDPVAFVAEGGGMVVTCLSAPAQGFPPFARNVMLPADLPLTATDSVFSGVWPSEAPAGTYIVFMADVLSGSLADGVLGPGDLLALATASLSFAK